MCGSGNALFRLGQRCSQNLMLHAASRESVTRHSHETHTREQREVKDENGPEEAKEEGEAGHARALGSQQANNCNKPLRIPMDDAMCVVCSDPLTVACIGKCEHKALCMPCGLRLRQLFEDFRCPVCKVRGT